MEYFIHAFGIKQVNTRFERMGFAAVDAEPAMQTVADMMFRVLEQVFESQGRRGGGSWKRDTPEWLKRKMDAGLDPRIGHATLALRHAFSEREAEHQILEIDHNSVNISTDLPYADIEQRNRPFIKFTQRDRLRMRTVVRDYLVAAWRRG